MNYVKTWKKVILKPSEFYWKMPATGGYAEPLIFAAINYIISWILSILVSFIILTIYASEFNYSDLGVIFMIMGAILLAIFFSLIILALIANFLYKAMGGTGSFEGTLRLSLYASAALIFLSIIYIIPVVFIYEMYLLIVGGMVVHTMSMQKSIIVIYLSFLLSVVFIWTLATLFSFAH